jgi:signal transduction histidine kinase
MMVAAPTIDAAPVAAAGGTVPAAAAPPDPPSSLPEEVRSVFDYMPATLLGTLSGILVLQFLFWDKSPLVERVLWGCLAGAVWLARAWQWRRFLRSQPGSLAEWARWRLGWTLGTLSSGACWGLAAWVFYLDGHGVEQTGLIVVVYTFCVAVVPILATQPRAYLFYAALCFVPMVTRIALIGDFYHLELAGILLLIFTLTALLARNYRQALQRALDLKLHADELLLQLRDEKRAADAARQVAEVANRAKTQFFTAASHDLRQPLHAMGLFAEALRSKVHDAEVAHLVNSINESVDALESLFSELLDITRIDSGGVAVHPRAFEVDDILRKLRLHFEPTAFEKGLALRLRGGHQVVEADPLLVERILRNLVSNAIRYTADGTVLVSARRRGQRVLLQVWDTGVGIPPQEQARVFEEFYQVPGGQVGAPGEAMQRKGLGLGLAIVRRLADLIQAPLSLRSEPGRGTVFTLELPVGRLVRGPAELSSAKAAPALTLAGQRILVVEDEPAVRSGLEVLLRDWGADLVSLDSVAAALAWTETDDAVSQRPDLLIVDYRLEPGRTGTEAIRLLRARLGDDIPAIVVTGSTLTGLEREAQEERFHLLIKPVVPNKLRAMIAFKLKTR